MPWSTNNDCAGLVGNIIVFVGCEGPRSYVACSECLQVLCVYILFCFTWQVQQFGSATSCAVLSSCTASAQTCVRRAENLLFVEWTGERVGASAAFYSTPSDIPTVDCHLPTAVRASSASTFSVSDSVTRLVLWYLAETCIAT